MERKEQDLLLNLTGNSSSTIQDLMQSGLNVFNTSLEDKKTYQNSESIQNNPNFQNQLGEFDPTILDNSYKAAILAYNYMSEDQLNKYIMDTARYSSQNIFAPIKQRDYSQGFIYHKLQNPDRITRGLVGINKNSTPEFSASELAQNEEVVDHKTGKKLPKPNGNWFKYFTDTLVLAQYDKDVDINGKEEGQAGFDPNNIEHKKGEYKLNENGTYYYETLGGRDVTNRKVLWKGDTLTEDGSWANKHLDFFDSDDIDQNSGAKTTLKNLALVGSMFIPGVGEYIALTSALVQTAGLFGTVGRVITGDSSEFARNLEGWGQSMNRQSGRTEAAASDPWSMESFVNLVADVAAQLREQRAVFKQVPKLFNKGKGVNEEYLAELKEKYLTELKRVNKIKYTEGNVFDPRKVAIAQQELDLANQQKAADMVQKYVQKFYDVGGDISKLYMTGITVQNAYGEAIQQGVSPMEAFWYTLGYAAGEWKLLNTGVGEWILPELRMQKLEHKQIVRTLFSDILKFGKEASSSSTTKHEKFKLLNKLMKLGQQVAHTDYTVTKGVLSNTVANALGEGIEEVSEELLADLAKQAYNTIKWIQGDTTRLDAWQDMGNRYLLSFVGGALGGGLAGVGLDNLRYAHSLKNMTTQQATEKLVAISRDQNQRDAFLKNLSKLDLGNSHLSATKAEFDAEGRFIGWKPGTEEDNQDKAAKDVIKAQLQLIDNVLESNAAKLDDESFLKEVIKDVRYGQLLHTNAGNRMISRFNTIMSKIYSATEQLKNINSPENQEINGDQDQKDKESTITKNQRKQVEDELKQLIQEKDDLLSGKYSAELALEALIEMNPYVMDKLGGMSAIRYAEARSGLSYDKISDKLKDKYLSDYKNIAETNGKDTVAMLTSSYLKLSNLTLPALQEMYDGLKNNSDAILKISQLTTGLVSQLDALDAELQQNGTEDFLETVQQGVSTQSIEEKFLLTLMEDIYTEEQKQQLQNLADQYRAQTAAEEQQKIAKEIYKTQLKISLDNVLPMIQQVVDSGFVNSVMRQTLLDTLKLFQHNYGLIETNVEQRNSVEDLIKKLQNIEEVKHTPIEQVLDKFILDANLSDIRFTGLINSLNSFYNDVKKEITEFLPSENLLERVGEAIKLLDLFEAVIYGARTDKLGVDILQDSGTRKWTTNPNYFGINAIVKELAEKYGADEWYKALPTIEGQLADQITQDLGVLKKQLVFYYDLLAINSGQKLSKQKRTEVNLNYLLYRGIKNFVVTIPDDWKEKDKLQGVIDSMIFTGEHYTSETKSLSEEDQITLEKEKIAMFQGIHDFFKANQDKVDDVNQLSKLLDVENLNLFGQQKQTLTENTTEFDGHILVSLLAAISAINPTDFYANYRTVISSDVAPIPGQELAILHSVAAVLNGDQIAKFMTAVKQSFYDHIVNETDDVKRSEIFKKLSVTTDLSILDRDGFRQYIMNEWVIPQFTNITLIEGIPGAGKSQAVLTIVKALLKSNANIAEKILANPWFVHTSQETAKALNDKPELENSVYFSHKDLIKKISDWEGNKENITYDEFGMIQPKCNINHLDKVPSIIFIDEVSKYTSLELKVIDRFAKTYGITIIALGDFDQSSAKDKLQIPEFIEIVGETGSKDYNLELNRTSFFTTFKLGDSFRVTNVQKEKNLGLLQAVIQTDNNKLALHYHFDKEKGLFGDYVISGVDYEEGANPLEDMGLKDIIDTMVNTTGEKIGFIYYDENSDLAQELLKPEYSDKIKPYYKNVAQGDEAQYFIIDFAEYDDDLDFKDFYTAVTRSKQGSLCFIRNGLLKLDENRFIEIQRAIQDSITYDSSLPAKSISEYSARRKERLDKVYEGKETNPLVYTPITKKGETVSKKQTSSSEEEVSALSDEEITVTTPLLSGVEFAVPKKVEKAKEKATVQDNIKDTETILNKNEDVVTLDLALYTHASSEIGLNTWNPDGTPDWSSVPEEIRKERIDSYFGLEKLQGDITKTEALQTLAQLRTRLLNIKDKSNLEENIKEYLDLPECYITFAIKNSANPVHGDWNDYKGYNKYAKSSKEELEDIFIEDKRAHISNRRQFVAIIGNGKQDVLEIPLGTLTSPITVINTTDSEGKFVLPEVKTIYQAAVDASGNNSPYEGIKAVIDKFDKDSKYKDLIQLCKLWINTGNLIAFQTNPSWTPAKNLIDQGGQVDQLKGINQTRMEILQYNKDIEPPIPIIKYAISPTFTISKIIVPRETVTEHSGFEVKAGQPIILWTANSLLQQGNLEEEFLKGNPDVKFAYINLPSYTVSEYLISLYNFVKTSEPPVGNIFTAYSIMQKLAFDDEGNQRRDFEEFIKELNPASGQDIYDTLITQLKELRDIKPDESISDVNEKHTNYNKQLKQKLLETSKLFEGKPWAKSGATIASQFQNIFIKLTETKIRTTGDTIIIDDNVKKIDKLAGEYKVIDQIKLSQDSPNSSKFIEVLTDPDSAYKMKGKEVTISSKLTSKAFISPRESEGNLMDWIYDIVDNVFHEENGNRKSTDNEAYITNNCSKLSKQEKTEEERTLDNIYYVLERLGQEDGVRYEFFDHDVGSIEEMYAEAAWAINVYSPSRLAISLKDDLLIIKIENKINPETLSFIVEHTEIQADGTYKVQLLSEGNQIVYEITYNPTNNKLEVTQPVEEVVSGNLDLNVIKDIVTNDVTVRTKFTVRNKNMNAQLQDILQLIENSTDLNTLIQTLQTKDTRILESIARQIRSIQNDTVHMVADLLSPLEESQEQTSCTSNKLINISKYGKMSSFVR